nr:MAG TPA: hypothetical protein [Caudoviricetes sp.]
MWCDFYLVNAVKIATPDGPDDRPVMALPGSGVSCSVSSRVVSQGAQGADVL